MEMMTLMKDKPSKTLFKQTDKWKRDFMLLIIMKRIKIIGIWLLIIMPYASKPSEFIYLLQNVLPG